MITDQDIEKLKEVFVTKTELRDELGLLRQEMKQNMIDMMESIEKVFNDFAQSIDKRLERIEKAIKIHDAKIDLCIEKISEMSIFKLSLIDHEKRIWELEQKN